MRIQGRSHFSVELHLSSSLQTSFGVFGTLCLAQPVPATGMRSHRARVQCLARITAGIKPLSSVWDLLSGTALFPARLGWSGHTAMFEPWPWQALAPCVKSRLYLSTPGLQQSLGIPIFAFSPCSLSIGISWHSQGDIQPRHRVTQRCPDSEGESRVTWLPTPKGKPGKKLQVCKNSS